jgi:hypothetical protein
MILVGLVLGRWWRTALLVGALGWPALLIADNVPDLSLVEAAVLGLVNTAVGVGLHQAVLALFRLVKDPLARGRSTLRRGRWLTLGASIYVLVVAATAGVGFITESTQTILVAALLALPASIVALPGYYVIYGILALVPGANPSNSSGSGSCAPDETCHESATGDPAAWFSISADALGVLALSGAAVLNVVVLRLLIARRRRSTGDAVDSIR